MCNKNSRAREIKQMCRAHNSHTHKDSSKAQRPTHSPSNRRLFLGRSLCQGTRKSRGHTQNNNRSTLCKWVELREECAALCQYSCLLPCRFNRIPRISFRYSPSYIYETNGRAPYKIKLGRLYKSAMNVGCAHTRTHSPPSNRRLFLGRSLRRVTRNNRGRAQRNDRATLSRWVELGMFCQVNTPTRIAL